MYIDICKWCNSEIKVNNQQSFASHVSCCKANPNYKNRIEKLLDYHKKRELNNRVYTKCSECGENIMKKPSEIKKSKNGNLFCNRSCAATYNNKHKTSGTRRSKMEIWIEEQLKTKYNFEILFNNKEIIGSELDIYIPHLKLAFELNGIFHYEPIYGDKKFESIKNNDNRKFQACLEKEIEFCIIDTSGSKKFKPERDKKYLEIIEKVINMKNLTLQQQQPLYKPD